MSPDTPTQNPNLVLTRRSVAAAGIIAGFALAVSPAKATAIATDTAGLDVSDVVILSGGFSMPGYRARPAGKIGAPVVLVVQEIFGIHEHIKDICRRFAKQGYYAIAPSLYARQGDVMQAPDIDTAVANFVRKTPDAQVMGDLDATVVFAQGDGGDVARMGVTGFCWGGRVVWLYSAHNAALKAGVAWYGKLAGDSTEIMPRHPVDLAAELKCPVLGLYGGADKGIPVETVEQMRGAIKAANGASEIVVYPDTPHGFHADYRDSYRPAAAADAWKRCLDWFKTHGVV